MAAMCANCPHSAIDHAYVPPYACRLCSCSGFVNAGFSHDVGLSAEEVAELHRLAVENGDDYLLCSSKPRLAQPRQRLSQARPRPGFPRYLVHGTVTSMADDNEMCTCSTELIDVKGRTTLRRVPNPNCPVHKGN